MLDTTSMVKSQPLQPLLVNLKNKSQKKIKITRDQTGDQIKITMTIKSNIRNEARREENISIKSRGRW